MNYEYKAIVERVVDGDTLDLLIDLGFDTHVRSRVRLYGIDTPETRTRDKVEKAAGLAAKQFVIDWLEKEHWEITVTTFMDKKGKYGRILATIHNRNFTSCLNDTLITNGHAEIYKGGKR